MRIRYILACILLTFGFYIASAQNYKRIVSLSRVITQDIYLLQAQNNLVGCTSFCDMAIKDGKQVVASAIEINIEKIVLLKPDLVIATTLTKPATIETLRNIGIKVVAFPTTKSYNDICSEFQQIATFTGKDSAAYQLIAQQKYRLDLLIQKIQKNQKPRIFFEIGTKPIFTVMPNTFMDDYITLAGGINVASDLKHGTITRESVILRNPDVIVIVTMGILGEEEKQNWLSCKELSATKSNKVFIIDSDKACSPTPISFVDVVEDLIKNIYQ